MKTWLTKGDVVRRTNGSNELGRITAVYSKYAMVEFAHSRMIVQSLLLHNDLEVVDEATMTYARESSAELASGTAGQLVS
jgi:hypothetical protein